MTAESDRQVGDMSSSTWLPPVTWPQMCIPGQYFTYSNCENSEVPVVHLSNHRRLNIRSFRETAHYSLPRLLNPHYSVAVLEESPCPREFSRTNFQVLVLVLGHQVLVIVLVLGSSSHRKFSRIELNNVACEISSTIVLQWRMCGLFAIVPRSRSSSCRSHRSASAVLLSSRKSPRPRGSSRTNFQVLVLVLVVESQVLDNNTASLYVGLKRLSMIYNDIILQQICSKYFTIY